MTKAMSLLCEWGCLSVQKDFLLRGNDIVGWEGVLPCP